MANPKIAAVVLQHGQWRKTAESALSLFRSSLPPAWTIVVDNASPDDSGARIEEWLAANAPGPFQAVSAGAPAPNAPFILVKSGVNGGYAAGNNIGLRLGSALGADAFLLLNSDARLEPGALEAMWRALSQSRRPGLAGPLIARPLPGSPAQCCGGGRTSYVTGLSTFIGDSLSLEAARRFDKKYVEGRLNFICGACVLAHRDFVAEVGLMDEGFFLYCEEQDWALRAKGRFDLAYAPDALCYHDEGASTGWSRRAFNLKSSLRLLRSRLRLAALHHPRYLPTVALGCLFAAGRLVAKRIAAAAAEKLRKKTPPAA